MSFPVIGAPAAVPIHQYTKSITKSTRSNEKITIPKSEHGLTEPIVTIHKEVDSTTETPVIVADVKINKTSKAVVVTVPKGGEFAGKIIIN